MVRTRLWKLTILSATLLVVISACFVGIAAAKNYKVGKSAPSGDLVFTVYGYQDPYTSDNQFLSPDPGNHFVTVDVEVKNPSKDQKSFSSLLFFHLVDKTNKQYDESIMGAGQSPGPPDGQIPGKGAVRGTVAFEVPDGAATPLRFRAQGNLTASGAYWNLKPPPAPAP